MRGSPIPPEVLQDLYVRKQLSAHDVGLRLGCSTNKVHYWLDRSGIKQRSQSQATYAKRNPDGDPFEFSMPKHERDLVLYGLGLGLYWGEGNKRNLTAVRLGNTDPKLIAAFIRFLLTLYKVDRRKLRFGLQIFSDMHPQKALQFWRKAIGFPRSHFLKPVVTPARSVGTYRSKTKHGVLTVYVSNKKLRDLINSQIETITHSRYYR